MTFVGKVAAFSIGFWLLSGLAQAAPISKVQITGNKRIESDAIRERMKLKEGSELSKDAVSQDILSIFSLGFFEDVRIEEDGGTLIVAVKERPVVTEIKYEGSDEFEDKELEETTGLKAFNVLNLTKIRQAQTAIAKKYEEKGYYLARADFEIQPISGNNAEIRLLFKIQENEKVRIRKIFFLGNKVFSSGELKKIMLTSEGHVFSWATNGGTYREAAFDRDMSALAYFYANEGYIEAKFSKPRVTLSQDRRYVDIFIDVEEGKQYFLGDVKFSGELLFTLDDLRKSFDMKEDDVFSMGKLQEEVLKLTDKYGDEGYAFANVIPRTQVREGTDKADLLFEIEKGEKVYWGKITVTGNTKTHDKVIRRELPFNEGELYNATKRKKGLEKVRRLGFFGNDVNFLTSTPPGSSNLLNLEIRVSEKPTGSLNVSAGWGSAAGLQFGGQVSQNNLRGLGQQLTLQLNWNNQTKTFSLGFQDPHIFDTDWLAGIDLYVQDNDIGSTYKQKLSGGALRVGRELRENLSLYGTYKLERARLTDPIDPAVFTTPEDANSLISSFTATLAYDTRNNRLDPSDGEYMTVASEFAGLGGRVFQKYTTSLRMYRRIGWRFVYRTNFEYGMLSNFSGGNVPDTERFVLGGIFSLRGYDNATVGPIRLVNDYRSAYNMDGTATTPPTARTAGQPVKDKDGNPVSIPVVLGGRYKLVYNHEIEFPLIPDADIRAVVFMDIGNAWNSMSEMSPSFLTNLGWGIRWYSPLGPLRFEWGYPLHMIKTSPLNPAFQFIIAPTF